MSSSVSTLLTNYYKQYGTLNIIIDRAARELIRLVASVCVRMCPSVCLWALSCLNRLTFDLDFGMRVDLDLG